MTVLTLGSSYPRRTERVSQAALDIITRNTGEGFAQIRVLLLGWLEFKVGHSLPSAMACGETDSLDDVDALRTETVELKDPLFWSFRRNDHDRDYPQRTWVTECSIARDKNRLRLGYRLHLINRGEPAPFQRSIPRFVREIAKQYSIQIDGRDVDLEASHIEFEEEVNDLIKFIKDDKRTVPIVGVSSYSDIQYINKYALPADRIASLVFGTAHVYTITSGCCVLLSEKIGKQFSVYKGAVRIWLPERQLHSDERSNDPLYLYDKIADDGPDRVLRAIVSRVLSLSAQLRDSERAVPSFSDVRRVASTLNRQQALDAGRSSEQMLPLYEAENRRLTEYIVELRAEHDSLLLIADNETIDTIKQRDDARAEVRILNTRLRVLQEMLGSHVNDPMVPITDDFSDIEEWSHTHLDERVFIMPRAFRSARKSFFENPAMAYQALLLIKNAYVPMRRTGSPESCAQWDAGLQQLGLSLSPTFSGPSSGSFGDEYFINWLGRRRELDCHLKGSNSRDPRYGFRLYFLWCEERKCAVVGSFPSHLDNKMT